MSRKKGGMEGGPAEQGDRGTHGAFESEPDVRIPPHETEGSWRIGDRGSRPAPRTARKSTSKTTGKKNKVEE
jgi:hypothetical protein